MKTEGNFEAHNPDDEIESPGRREFFAAGAGGLLKLTERQAEAARDPLRNIVKKRYPMGELGIREIIHEVTPQRQKIRDVAVPRKFGSLFADYLGVKEGSQVADTDFGHQLAVMWGKKVRIANDNIVVPDLGKQLAREYLGNENRVEGISLEKYLLTIDKEINEVWKNLDWNRLTEIMNIKPSRTDVVRAIAASMNSKHMTAYSLTELMPSNQGELNEEVLRFLLQNAGADYVYSLPALNDKKTSFGPYQMSEFSVFDAKGAGTGQDLRGASIVNRAMDHHKLPGSVSKLRGQQHHQAAFMFAIYNLMRMARVCTPKEFAVLQKQWQSGPVSRNNIGNMVEFVAAVHHNDFALHSARQWLDSGAKKDFYLSCGPIDTEYAKRTKVNLQALENAKRLTHTERTVIVKPPAKR